MGAEPNQWHGQKAIYDPTEQCHQRKVATSVAFEAMKTFEPYPVEEWNKDEQRRIQKAQKETDAAATFLIEGKNR